MESRHLNLLALIAALSLSVLSSGTDALSMGALQKSYVASANPGDVAAFTLLFWNIEIEPYDVELSANAFPEGWSIILDPKSFTLSSKPQGKTEYIYLPYLKKSIQAKAVGVYVRVPENAVAGKHLVSVVSTAKPPGSQVPVNFVGQKRFTFEIIVGGAKRVDENLPWRAVIIENPGILETVPLDSQGKQHAVTVENPGTYALVSSENATGADSRDWGRKPYFAAVAAILVIAWVIYRYE